ncbi:MAG: helix-turn-helix domain-containing protein, partial [Actinobacteria bacterium]|nr:helix-turn-helix domain-containing protein [Actinomycetota bacterium]
MTQSLQVSDEDRATLTAWSRSTAIRAGLVTRARIVLASADGHCTSEVSRRVGVSRPTVIQWRNRYAAEGLAGLEDTARSGRPVHVDEDAIVAATMRPPPNSLGVTHWSTRLLAAHLGVGDATVARCWRKYLVQPWRRGSWDWTSRSSRSPTPRRCCASGTCSRSTNSAGDCWSPRGRSSRSRAGSRAAEPSSTRRSSPLRHRRRTPMVPVILRCARRRRATS